MITKSRMYLKVRGLGFCVLVFVVGLILIGHWTYLMCRSGNPENINIKARGIGTLHAQSCRANVFKLKLERLDNLTVMTLAILIRLADQFPKGPL